MEEKFNNQANPQGSQNAAGNKSGIGWKIVLMVILAALVLSPIDALPDVIPVVGWVDDVAYAAGILGSIVGMLKGKRSQQLPGGYADQGYIPPMYNEVNNNRKK